MKFNEVNIPIFLNKNLQNKQKKKLRKVKKN